MLKVYNAICEYGLYCIGETFLNSPFESNNKDLMMEGHNLIPKELVFVFIAKSL